MKKFGAITVLLVGVSMASACDAAPRGVRDDARCLLSMALSTNDPSFKQAGTLGSYFFSGRILSQEPKFDFSTRLAQEASQMTVEEVTAERIRCAAGLKAAIEALNASESSLNNVQLKPSPTPH